MANGPCASGKPCRVPCFQMASASARPIKVEQAQLNNCLASNGQSWLLQQAHDAMRHPWCGKMYGMKVKPSPYLQPEPGLQPP